MRYRLTSTVTSIIAAGLLAAAGASTSCAEAFDDGDASPNETATADESTGDLGGKADIYGDDDRREYFETESEPLRKVARASGVLLDADEVTTNDDGEVTIPDEPLSETLPACPSAKFSDQPAPGGCSGFLVAPDVLVSAGHCIKDERDCESTRVAFDFRYEESTDEDVATLAEEDVYSCKSIISRDWQRGEKNDYGVYRLDRPVEGVDPLDFRTDGKVAPDTQLAVVGHPMGLPLKITAGGRIVDNEPTDWFLYNLDAFGGHSGAAVVDVETGVVEGIHVRGAPDYKYSRHEGDFCYEMRTCEEVDPDSRNCFGTEGTRATVFAPHVPTATTGSNGTENCCTVCRQGQACGDACISTEATCRQPFGCACEAPD